MAINNFYRQIFLLNYLHLLLEREEKETFIDIINWPETKEALSQVRAGIFDYSKQYMSDIENFYSKCMELAF